VLQNADGKLFLLSDQNLDCKKYNEIWTGITWEQSTIRAWLNGTSTKGGTPCRDNYGKDWEEQNFDYKNDSFIKTAFVNDEQETVITTEVKNKKTDDYMPNPYYENMDGGNDTNDKIFLLSINDAQNVDYGFTDNYEDSPTRVAKNTDYVSATADKMRTLLTNDKSIKAKMTRLMEVLKDSNTDNTQDEILEHFYPNIALESSSYMDDSSLFVRSYYMPDMNTEPLYIDDSYDVSIDTQASDFIENMNNTYSNKNVIAFVEKKLENKNELESAKFKIETDEDLILTIHSMLKGWDKNVFYKIELGEGNIDNNCYSIPKMTYYRRRKL
jgi:hypothetical protein